MALPLAAPLISLGFEIVDKFFDKDEDKINTKERLLRLEAEGKVKDLQKEIERLKDITSIDTTSNKPATPEEQELIVEVPKQEANFRWKDRLGSVVAAAFGLDLLIRPIVNQTIEMYNAHIDILPYPAMPPLSMEEMGAAIAILVGVGGLTLAQNKMSTSDKIKQLFGK